MNIKITLGRAATMLKLRVASFLDRGIDGALNQFVKLDEKLEAYIARQEARASQIDALVEVSFNRVRAVEAQERGVRVSLYDQRADAGRAADRATRVRERINALLD